MNKNIWQKKDSPHYNFHYFPNSAAEKNINSIIKFQEDNYTKILDFLGIENNKKINYFLYPDNKTKGDMMGDDGNGNANWDKFEVHAVYNDKIQCIGSHEDTHLLSLPIGISVKLFREGLAEYMSKTWHGESHDYWAHKFKTKNRLPDFSLVIDNDVWDKYDDMIAYPCAGSFISFLIKSLGKEKYLLVYGSLDQNKPREINLETFFNLTGNTISQCQEEWEKGI